MQEATAETMLGDFNNVTFKAENETTRFSRKDDGFWVNTPGIDGKNADFKVAYTFGIAPLQQYLIGMPGGRYQALGIACALDAWLLVITGTVLAFIILQALPLIERKALPTPKKRRN